MSVEQIVKDKLDELREVAATGDFEAAQPIAAEVIGIVEDTGMPDKYVETVVAKATGFVDYAVQVNGIKAQYGQVMTAVRRMQSETQETARAAEVRVKKIEAMGSTLDHLLRQGDGFKATEAAADLASAAAAEMKPSYGQIIGDIFSEARAMGAYVNNVATLADTSKEIALTQALLDLE